MPLINFSETLDNNLLLKEKVECLQSQLDISEKRAAIAAKLDVKIEELQKELTEYHRIVNDLHMTGSDTVTTGLSKLINFISEVRQKEIQYVHEIGELKSK